MHVGYGVNFELDSIPRDAERTILGWSHGAKTQWRGPGGLHIREYADGRLIAHYDRVDPRDNFLGHMVQDALKETLVLSGLGALLFRVII
jgi:hypothetical protein